MKRNKIKKVYKILAGLLTIIFYWVIFPLFLFWFSFKVQIGRLNIPNLLAYGIGFIVVVYGLYWYIGAGIAQHKPGVKIFRNYKSTSFLSYLFQLNPPDKLDYYWNLCQKQKSHVLWIYCYIDRNRHITPFNFYPDYFYSRFCSL